MRARLSAGDDGNNPADSSLARMNGSMEDRGQSLFLTTGMPWFLSGSSDQGFFLAFKSNRSWPDGLRSPRLRSPRPALAVAFSGQGAPDFTQVMKSAMFASDSLLLGG